MTRQLALTIARKELRELACNRALCYALVAVAMLLALSVFLNWRSWAEGQAERMAAAESDSALWNEQGEKNQHSAAHYGLYAFKPESALSIFDGGLSKYVGTAVYLEPHKQNFATLRPAERMHPFERLADPTPAWFLQFILPLFVIALSYRAISGERERGTLAQLQCLGLGGTPLILGKFFAMAAVFALLLGPLAATGALTLLFSSTYSADLILRLLLLTALYAAYTMLIIMVCLLVSASVKRSNAALAVLLGLWVLFCVLIPRFTGEAAGAAFPEPTRAAYLDGITARSPAPHAESISESEIAKLEAEVLAEFPEGGDSAPKLNEVGLKFQVGEDMTTHIHAEAMEEVWRTHAAQQRIVAAAGLLSPVLAVREASMFLSGTDVRHHTEFVRQAEDARVAFVRFLNFDMAKTEQGHRADATLWEQTPRPDIGLPTLGRFSASSLLTLPYLLVLALVAFFLARRRVST